MRKKFYETHANVRDLGPKCIPLAASTSFSRDDFSEGECLDLIARWGRWRPSRIYGDLTPAYFTIPERMIPSSDSYRNQVRRSNSPASDRISIGVAFE